MKTIGLIPSQQLVSLQQDDDGNWIDVPEGETVVPLVKLPQPEINPLEQYCEPKLVWFDDRVERDWETLQIPPLPPEQIAAEAARKAAQEALRLKRITLLAPYSVQPEGFSLATSVDDQNSFTRLLTLLNLAGVEDATSVAIADVHDKMHHVTFARLKQIMVQYGLEMHQRWVNFKS